MSSVVIAGDISGSITIAAPATAGSNTLTLPVATDTLVGKATTDTLTNKTLVAPALGAATATSLTVSGAGTFNGALCATHNAFQSIIALTDAATIAVDMSVTGGNNFSVTLGANRTLGNPTGLTAGQSGVIYITQDGTGSRTLAFSSFWDFQNIAAPSLSTNAGAIDVLVYSVRSSTSIVAQLITNIG